MDIVIPQNHLEDFFFMNDEEEKAKYGASTNLEQAAQMAQTFIKSA